MYKCPVDPTHDRFRATAIENHDWIVDEHGEFIEDIDIYDARLIEVRECDICGAEV